MLKIYNTLSRQKEDFQPIEAGKARLYVCGMTVYDYCHLGHARVMVVFDLVTRYLRHAGYDVTYVRNITDVDDKIIKRAAENSESIETLTQRFIDAMHQDERALNVLEPDIEPRATASMESIIVMIRALIERGHAYVGKNGDVFYAVSSFENYGRLSGKNLDELQAGERVEVDQAKNDPLDFVLWKMAKPDEPGWDSPWGMGRPGWHIECSAMSTGCLGNHFDIHGGGMDLQFPHHENEIAQSEGASGERFVNLWMHNGFVRIDDEKMSKSLNNFFTVREVMKRYRPEVIRFFILTSHYRSPLNYSDHQLDEAATALARLYTALRGVKPTAESAAGKEFRDRFEIAMSDDFNTPIALAVLFDLAREINRHKNSQPKVAAELAATLLVLGHLLGTLTSDPDDYLKTGGMVASEEALSDESINQLVQQRLDAREQRDWAEADRIRDSLKEQGIVLEDRAGTGTTEWRRVFG